MSQGRHHRPGLLGGRTGLFFAFALFSLVWTIPPLVVADHSLHSAPIALVGPSVVTTSLAEQVSTLDNEPFAVVGTTSRRRGSELIASGEVIAMVVIDLSGSRDTLVLAPGHRPSANDRLIQQLTEIERSRGRTLTVQQPAAVLRGPPLVRVAGLCSLAGWLLVLVVSVIWGPMARSLKRGAARVAALGILATVTGSGIAAAIVIDPGMDFSIAVTVALTMGATVMAAGMFTLACESLAGLRGLVLAAAAVGVMPFPLIMVGDRLLLAMPWAQITDWTLPGAAARAINTIGFTDDPAWLQPVVTLAGAALLGLAVLLTARAYVVHDASALAAEKVARSSRRINYWRGQLAGLAILIIASTVLVVTVWSAVSDEDIPVSLASLASTSKCVKSGGVSSVDDLNRVAQIRGTASMRGGDVGASATLSDGRSVWMFGDTIRDAGVGGGQVVRNSMLVVNSRCLRLVEPASGGAIIPNRSAQVGYWPMSVVVNPKVGYDLLLVTCQRVRTTDPDDPFGFENLGGAVATFVVASGSVPQLISVVDLGDDDADTTRPTWGAATATSGRTLYLYGTSRDNDAEVGSGFAMRVAKVDLDRVTNTAQWRYWTGLGWSADQAQAGVLIPADGGVSQTLSAFRRDGVWYAFSKRNEFLGQDLVFWTAPSPQGPFTAQAPVASVPSDSAAGVLRYMPLAHPDLLPEDGSMVISYSQNTTDPGAALDDPTLYRPRFMRVPLPTP